MIKYFNNTTYLSPFSLQSLTPEKPCLEGGGASAPPSSSIWLDHKTCSLFIFQFFVCFSVQSMAQRRSDVFRSPETTTPLRSMCHHTGKLLLPPLVAFLGSETSVSLDSTMCHTPSVAHVLHAPPVSLCHVFCFSSR